MSKTTNIKSTYKPMKATPIRVSDWQVNNVRYKPAVTTTKMTRVGVLNGASNRAITLEMPLFTCYGIKDYVEEGKETGNDRFSLSLQLPDPNSPELSEPKRQEALLIINKFKELEAKILSDAFTHQSEWFGADDMSREVINSKWTPILKYPRMKDANGKPIKKKADYSRAPSLSVSVPKWEGEWKVELYDNSRPTPNLIFPTTQVNVDDDGNEYMIEPPELVPMFSRVKVSMTCGGIWLGQAGFGVTWKLVEAIVVPSDSTAAAGRCGVALNDDEGGDAETYTKDDGELKTASAPLPPTPPMEPIVEEATVQTKDVTDENNDDESGSGSDNDSTTSDQIEEKQVAAAAAPPPPPAAAIVKRTINKAPVTPAPVAVPVAVADAPVAVAVAATKIIKKVVSGVKK